MSTFNPYHRMILVVILITLFFATVSMACTSNPCSNGSACGITAPRDDKSVTQRVIDWLEKTDPDGTSNNW